MNPTVQCTAHPRNHIDMQNLRLRIAFLSILAAIFAPRVWSQCVPLSYKHLDANQVDARINAGGEQHWDLVSRAQYAVPKQYDRHCSFASSLWIGGLDQGGALHMAASTYRQNGEEYYAGPHRNGFAYRCGDVVETPVGCVPDGVLWLANGHYLHLYAEGFQVYDPLSQTASYRYLPVGYSRIKPLELPSGDVAILRWANALPNNVPSQMIVVDVSNGYLVGTPVNLLHDQTDAAMVALANGKVLIIGAQGVEEFDPVSLTSVPKTPRPTSVARHDARLLSNGKVLVTSGAVAALELYDPVADAWLPGASTTVARPQYPKLTPLPNGQVLISGGTLQSGLLEIYDPATNSVALGPNLPDSMARNSAHVVDPDHVVLLNGDDTPVHQPIKVDLVSGTAAFLPYYRAQAPAASRAERILLQHSLPTQFRIFDGVAERFVNHRWQQVWKITRAQVQQFQADFANQQVDFADYPDLETWPGNGNVWAGEDAQLAPYIDVDNDGAYDPANDGDYPCFPGDQGLWWVYNDDGPHEETMGAAFPVQIEALAYAYDCDVSPCPDTALDLATFYHYEITNKSLQSYHDVYIGLWRDFDIGNYADDYVGCDSLLGMAFAYNGDANDETAQGYGLNPPALGSMILPNGSIDSMAGAMFYENDFSIRGNPEVASHYYGYMAGRWKDGSLLLNGLTGQPTTYHYPGDAEWCGPGTGSGGWTEIFPSGNMPYDRRMVQSAGPFNFAPGQTLTLDIAVVYARGFFNDNLGSVCELESDAAAIRAWWQSGTASACFSLVTDAPEPASQPMPGLQVFPNPNNGRFTLRRDGEVHEHLDLELVNLQGQVVGNQSLRRGQSQLEWMEDTLPKGLYFLRVAGRSEMGVMKIVID